MHPLLTALMLACLTDEQLQALGEAQRRARAAQREPGPGPADTDAETAETVEEHRTDREQEH